MKDRVRLITKRTRGRSVAAVAAELRSYLVGWNEYHRRADTPRIFSDLDEWIRHRLRAFHLKQWKRGTTIYRELRARGMSAHSVARVAAKGRRWWKNSALLLHLVLPTPSLTSSEFRGWLHHVPLSEPPGADPHAGW
jgi:RNA-directed DNA polymerase